MKIYINFIVGITEAMGFIAYTIGKKLSLNDLSWRWCLRNFTLISPLSIMHSFLFLPLSTPFELKAMDVPCTVAVATESAISKSPTEASSSITLVTLLKKLTSRFFPSGFLAGCKNAAPDLQMISLARDLEIKWSNTLTPWSSNTRSHSEVKSTYHQPSIK